MYPKIKQFLLGAGLWYPLDFARKTPDALRWITGGCSGNAPHPIKMKVVESYLGKFRLSEFIETGTYLGETLGYIARRGIKCSSIELSRELYANACRRFKNFENVRLYQGDSADKLPALLKEITAPCLFWLDGHYSGGNTACGDTHTPASAELQAILSHPVKKHVILIDDARCFDGTNGYPCLDDFLKVIRQDGNYRAEVSTDIIRLTPVSG